MKAEEIIEMIKTNSEIDFIKGEIKINIERVFSDIAIGRIIINKNHTFSFNFDSMFKHDSDEIIYFSRARHKVFSWDTTDFKLVPKEI